MSVRRISRFLFAGLGGAVPLALAKAGPAAAAIVTHKIAMQVSENDPAKMNLTLNNVVNLATYYSGAGQLYTIEVVAYGPGLNMLRADTSPVKARLTEIKQSITDLTFSACDNTLKKMEKAEGRAIAIVPEARIVPAGVVRLTELQEEKYAYIKP
jgi:intracellular sulfur oxidation DsrE/DsrF family protein